VERKGLTLVPLELAFKRGFAKVTLASRAAARRTTSATKLKEQALAREARRGDDV
jgi:tmRNA-binding protein